MTAGTEVTRNASKVANGLKTITLRLQGMNDEGEESLEVQAQMEELFNKLGISVYDANGELKNTFDIMQTLSEVYPKLTNAEKAYVTETIAGKYQAQNAAAILNNFSTAIDATSTAMNSQGSAAKENAKVLESIQGHLQQLKSAFEEFSYNILNSGIIKLFLDLGTAILKVANSGFGQLIIKGALLVASFVLIKKTVLTIGSGIKSLSANMSYYTKKTLLAAAANNIFAKSQKNVGSGLSLVKTKMSGTTKGLTSTLSGLKSLNTEALKLPKGIKGISASLKNLGGSSSIVKLLSGSGGSSLASIASAAAPWVAAAAAIAATIGGVYLLATHDERAEKKSAEAYKKSKKELDEKKDKYEEIQSKIEKLEGKGSSLSIIESQQLAVLRNKLNELDKEIDKQTKITEEKRKQLEYDAAKNAKKKTTYNREDKDSPSNKPELHYDPIGYNRDRFKQPLQRPTGNKSLQEDLSRYKEIADILSCRVIPDEKKKNALIQESETIRKSLVEHTKKLLAESNNENLSEQERIKYALKYKDVMESLGEGKKGWKAVADQVGDIFDNKELLGSEKVTGQLACNTEDLGSALEKAGKDGKITEKEVKKLRKGYEAFDKTVKESGMSVKNYAGLLTYLLGIHADDNNIKVLSEQGKIIETNSKEIKNANSVIDHIQSSYDAATSAAEEYNKQGYISIDTLQSLGDATSEELSYMFNESGQLAVNEQGFKNLAAAQLDYLVIKQQSAFLDFVNTLAKEGSQMDSTKKKTQDLTAALREYNAEKFAKAAMDAADTGKEGKEFTTEEQEEIKKRAESVVGYAKTVESMKQKLLSGGGSVSGGGSGSGGSGRSGGGGGSSRKSAEDSKEWWEKELEALKNQFDYDDITIDEYINGLQGLLGRVDRGSEAWKKINEELQKQRLDKIKDDYDAGRISLEQYIRELENLQGAYRAGTEAWKDLAKEIKEAKLDLLEKQNEDLDAVLDAVNKKLEKQIDDYEDAKDAAVEKYEKEIEGLEDVQEKLEDQDDDYQRAQEAVLDFLDEQTEALENQLDSIEDYYDTVLDAMDKMNEDQERSLELAEAYDALMNAMQNKSKKVFREGLGWVCDMPSIIVI